MDYLHSNPSVSAEAAKPLCYYAYLRRSTDDEKQALSIESQREELTRRFGHLTIIKIIEEDGSAFKASNRPQFLEMMNGINSGKAEGIITWAPDRLSRNVLDASLILDALDRKVLKDIQFGSYHFHNSPEGKMMLGFALSQSKYFSEKLGIDVMRGMEKKCRMGHKPSKALLGYRNVRTEDRGRRYIEKDEPRFTQVRQMWDMLLTGSYTVPQIWRVANEEWGVTMPASRNMPERPLSQSTCYTIFESPYYAGYFQWGGQRYKGVHEAMITMEQYERAQIILGRSGKQRNRKHESAFTGLLRCAECSSMMVVDFKKRQRIKTKDSFTYVYYSCGGKKGPCSQHLNLREEDLIPQLRKVVEGIAVSPRLLDWVRKQLLLRVDDDRKFKDVQRTDLRRKYDNSLGALQNLVALYVSTDNGDKSLLTEAEFRTQKETISTERDRMKQLLDDIEKQSDRSIEQTIKLFDFALNALRTFDTGDCAAKHLVLATIGANWTMKDGIAHCEAKLPFAHITKALAIPVPQISRGEKFVIGSPKPKEENRELVLSGWWPRAESNCLRLPLQGSALPMSYRASVVMYRTNDLRGWEESL